MDGMADSLFLMDSKGSTPQYTRRGGGGQDYAQNLQKRMDFVQFVQESTWL